MPDFTIRRATRADLPALGRLGAALMRVHYAFDPQRFMPAGPDAPEGYAWFLGTQLRENDALVLVAERAGTVLGYVYASIEPRNWKELRDEAGFIHDVLVDEAARRSGVGRALMDAALEWLAGAGMPRAVLWTADQNASAQHLFSRLGFRRTMVEMTLELTGPGESSQKDTSRE
jgi:ribosomal protein S18 acetylase RimI-like enzyme